MKTRSGIYKVYSIVGLVCGALVMLFGVFIEAYMSGTSGTKFLGIQIALCVMLIFWGFFQYIELTSMYATSGIMKSLATGKDKPKKHAICFKPKFYADFGLLIFSIILFFSCISVIAMFIYAFITNGKIVSTEIVLLIALIVVNIVAYYQYYLRYNSVGTVMQLTYNEDDAEEAEDELQQISTRNLKAYSVFYLILSAVGCFVGIANTISVYNADGVLHDMLLPIFLMYTVGVINMLVYYLYYRDVSNTVKIYRGDCAA